MQLSAQSLEYVRYPVTATNLGAAYDPTGDPVAIAFKPVGQTPVPGDFHTATWETWETGVHYTKILVGPGGTVTLGQGSYVAWVKITDNPEVPVMQAPDQLVVGA